MEFVAVELTPYPPFLFQVLQQTRYVVWLFSSAPCVLGQLMGRASPGLRGVPGVSVGQDWGPVASSPPLTLKLAQFEQHQSPQEVPAPSWGEHQGLGGSREIWERFSHPHGLRWVLTGRAEADVSSLSLFLLSFAGFTGCRSW